MRLLLLHTQFGQEFDDNAGLDFEFPCQLIDSNFLHRTDCLDNSLHYRTL